MANKHYNWKRFWCPRSGQIILADRGYLLDPDDKWGSVVNGHLVTGAALASQQCVVLLGEPGIGKSKTLENDLSLEYSIDGMYRSLYVDLQVGDNEDRILDLIVRNDVITEWESGGSDLYLSLDSLDESVLRVRTIAALIVRMLKDLPVERLRLRVACRTAEWPRLLEDGLIAAYGRDQINVYELAPLRRIDVAEAARQNAVDPEAFLEAVERSQAVPLAIKPLTLEFLLALYCRNGALPSSQVELYEDGCRHLCVERNESRQAARMTGSLSADERMLVAGRIAALTVFGNKSAVYVDADGDAPLSSLSLREAVGGSETTTVGTVMVTETAIIETLGTGLFSARGDASLMGWAHQSYADFLAAWYVTRSGMKCEQMLSLISHPSDPNGFTVPQLRECAAWLASMSPHVLRCLIEIEPAVVVRSDVATADAGTREILITRLLENPQIEFIELFDDMHEWKRIRKLAHPKISDQLRPWLQDRSRDAGGRWFAIRLVEACELPDLDAELIAVALDPHDATELRESVAHAIAYYGSPAARVALKPLALGLAGDDPEDQLKGYALDALWPDYLTANELFPLITAPKATLLGGYRGFIYSHLVQHLAEADLVIALDWVATLIIDPLRKDPREHLAGEILIRAHTALHNQEVLDAFARAGIQRLMRNESVPLPAPSPGDESSAAQADQARRNVLSTMILQTSSHAQTPRRIEYGYRSLVQPQDVSWLIAQLEIVDLGEVQRAYAKLIGTLFRPLDPANFDIVVTAANRLPVLAAELAWALEPVELGSARARRMREDYEYEQEVQRGATVPLLDPPPIERVKRDLDAFEAGNLTAWYILNLDLVLTPDATGHMDTPELDLTTLPGWEAASSEDKNRIISAAEQFVLDASPEPDNRLAEGVIGGLAPAGVRAMRLLESQNPGALDRLQIEVWQRWTPSIVMFPVVDSQSAEKHHGMLRRAYHRVPEAVRSAALEMIDRESASGGHLFHLHGMQPFIDEPFGRALLDRSDQADLATESRCTILHSILQVESPQLAHFRTEAIGRLVAAITVSIDGGDEAAAVAFAGMLLQYDPIAWWKIAWPLVQDNASFGRRFVEAVAPTERKRGEFAKRLREDQLADLYLWLVQQYPHAEDPQVDGFHLVSPREMIADFRENMITALKHRGTFQAVAEIGRILRIRPDLRYLSDVQFTAQALARQTTWVPPSASAIIALVSDRSKRLVRSADELLDVIVESLKKMQADLKGETPGAPFLWDRQPRGALRPKTEDDLSNYVKRHLTNDLNGKQIVANREVQIRPTHGSKKGQRTDIRLDAIAAVTTGQPADIISVIVETKGNWHREILTAMELQLVGRYLVDNECRNGIYLVGWFDAGNWTATDTRRAQVPAMDIAQATLYFEQQAAGLSQTGVQVRSFVIDIP